MRTRKTVRAFFSNIEQLSSEDIAELETLKSLLMETVPTSVKRAHDLNQNYACIFEINDSDYYIEIPRSHWIPSIETLISWYSHESVQNYEKCSELSKLIEAIRSEKKREKKSKTSKTKRRGEEGAQLNKGSGQQDA